jgi:hypothetical protein
LTHPICVAAAAAAARAEQILDANAMQTRGTLASTAIEKDDRGLDSPSGALPAAKRGALPIVANTYSLARYELGAERSYLTALITWQRE